MSCVHYKFSSKLDYNTVTFDGLHITLNELKRQIMARERLKATDCDLQITNAQTREEYTDDEIHIPKHSSVIVRRTPIGGVKPAGRTFIIDRSDTAMVGSSRPTDSSPSMSLAQLSKTANLADANASEEDKIKAMISQSIHDYDPIHYSKKAIGPPPGHYICFRCGKAGHYIRQCPLQMDKSLEGPKPVKISKGIPQSFMVKADPDAKGAMLTSTGEYAIPAIDAEAYAQGKKERPPFVPRDQSASEDESDPIPDELLCPICNDLMSDAVVIPCCGNSYCDDCIRTSLLDSEEHVCYTCKQSDVSPDNLIANKFLRQAVNNFKNETGYTKHVRKQLQQVAPSMPRPLPHRHVPSRQQDPLMAHVAAPPPRALPPAALPAAAVAPPQPLVVLPPQAVSAPPPGAAAAAAIVRQDTPPLAPQPTHDARDRHDLHDNRETLDSRDLHDARDNREHHDARENRDSRDHHDGRDARDHHDGRDHHDSREHHDPRHDSRDQQQHHPRDRHDVHSPMQSGGQREPPPPGEADLDPHMMMNQGPPLDSRPQNCHLPLIGHPPPPRPLHHQQGPPPRPHQPHRAGGPVGGVGGPRHWDRNFRPREDHPPPRMQAAPFPPNAAPPVYAAPALYPPPPQIYPPPYSTGPGLIPPPPVGYQPQPMYPPGMQGINPPWMPPNNQHPLGPHPPPLNQPHLSKEEFYRQHHLHHHPDEVTSKLDEFTKDFHKELMKYCNAPKRRRRSYTRSRTYSRSPFSRSPFSRSRSRSRSYSYTPSRSRSRSRNRSYPRSPFSRRNGRSYGRTRSRSRSRSRPYTYRRSGSPRSPGPYRPPGGQGGWDGPDSAAFRSRSRSRTPGGFRRVSPGGGGGGGAGGGGGRKPPPREPPPFDGRDMSPGAHERWERDGYRQWERDYRDYYKYYRDYDGQPPHHRAHGSRDRERDRLSPPPRDYSPQGKSRRARDADRGAPSSFHQPSSSSSGTKTSSKSSKSKKVKKKKSGEEPEASHQSMDRGDATPVRDEPMDDAPSLSKTPPSSSKSGGAAKATASKSSSSASAKTPTKSGKTSSDKSKKDKASKVKVKAKTETAKVKGKKAASEATLTKKKEGSSSSSSAAPAAPPPSSKSSKTTKAPGPEEACGPAAVKKEKAKTPAPRPVLIKPRLVSSRIHPPPPQVLLDTPRPVHELHGGRDPLKNAGLLPLPMQHGLLMLPHHQMSLQMDKRRRPGEERPPFLLGLPPNKLRCIGVPGMGMDRLPHTQMVLPAQLLRVPNAMDRPGILPTPGAPRDPGRGDMGQRDMGQRDMGQRDMGQRDMGQRDMGQRDLGQRDLGQRDLGQRDLGQRDLGQRDLGQRDLGQRDLGQRDLGQRDVGQRDMGRGDIRPLMDLQVKPMAPRRIKLNRDLGRKNSTEGPSSDKPPVGPEKSTGPADKASSGNTPAGERPTRGPEPPGRRERSVSRERGGSRERPGSGRERDRCMGLDRDRDRVSGADRERDRIPGSDRERDRIPGSDRERDTNLGIDRERDRISRSDRDRDRDRDRISGSDRDRDRVSGSDRERDRLPGSDRERDRVPASDRERDRLPGSDKGRERAPGSGKERDRSRGPDRERGQSSDSDRHREKTSSAAAVAAERMAVTVERDAADGQRSVKTDKSDPGGGGVARSVSVDKMTIAERSAIARKPAEPAEKTRRPSKETDAEASEKGPKTDRGVSKDRAERTGSSGEKPAAAHREAGKGSDASAVKSRSRVNRKALTSRPSGSRPAETGRSDSDQNPRSGSSKDSDPRSQSPADARKHSPTPEPSPGRVEDLIQPPPRSKWERDDEEEWPENGLAAPAEKAASPPRGREKEKHPDAPKPLKSLARDGPKEEKRGAAKEEKTPTAAGTAAATTTTTGKGVKQEGKAVKTSQAVKAKAPRDESRGHGRADGRSGGAGGGEREEAKGVAGKEERATGGAGAGREESRGPEPRRQRLCSDLGRETDEAAFVPDYSEGEGSEPQKGGSASATPSHSAGSGSPAHSNASGSVATTAAGDKKKKKKRKKDKKHKKHKKHSGQDGAEEAEAKERKHKHKKKKHKKSKEAEEPGSKTSQD